MSSARERCPSLSSEMNNHISTQIKGDLIKVGGPRRAWQGREEGIFNLEECALNKTDKKQRKKRKRKKGTQAVVLLRRNAVCIAMARIQFICHFYFHFPQILHPPQKYMTSDKISSYPMAV